MTKTLNLKTRRYDLDWLRVIAILILLFFHVGMFFTTWDWHIKNNVTSATFDAFMVFFHQWRMPLLLFISGAGTIYATARRSKKEFIIERHKRLMIPLIFSMFVIVPPQIYLEKIANYTSYLDFYPSVLDLVPYPAGNFSWHHMWFVLYLLIYSMMALPFISYLKSEKSASFLTRLENYFSLKWGFLSFVLPITLSQIILRPYFPNETHAFIDDWAYFTYYFFFFIAGICVASSDQLWMLLKEKRRFHLLVAVISLIFIQFLWNIPWEKLQNYLIIDINLLWQFNKIILTWAWIIAIIGYGQKYLNKNHPILKPANEAVYPFYILHQTVIILIAFPLTNVETGVFSKFIILSVLSLIATIGIYLIFVRPFNFMRFLFGMKPRKKKLERAPIPIEAISIESGTENH